MASLKYNNIIYNAIAQSQLDEVLTRNFCGNKKQFNECVNWYRAYKKGLIYTIINGPGIIGIKLHGTVFYNGVALADVDYTINDTHDRAMVYNLSIHLRPSVFPLIESRTDNNKNTVTLTETELKYVIKESVREILHKSTQKTNGKELSDKEISDRFGTLIRYLVAKEDLPYWDAQELLFYGLYNNEHYSRSKSTKLNRSAKWYHNLKDKIDPQ